MRVSRLITLGLAALAVVAGVMFLLQRQMTAELREEIGLHGDTKRELSRLRAENERLKAAQVSAEELGRLRADHAAVERLRDEIEKLKAGLQMREQKLADNAAPPAGGTLAPATLTLSMLAGADGTVSIDGAPVDPNLLRQRLASLSRGESVEIRVRTGAAAQGTSMEELNKNLTQVMNVGKELGLKIRLQLER